MVEIQLSLDFFSEKFHSKGLAMEISSLIKHSSRGIEAERMRDDA